MLGGRGCLSPPGALRPARLGRGVTPPDGTVLLQLPLASLRILLFQSSPLRASILEPSFNLSLAELQHLGQSLPLRRREVLLRLELLLQLNRLVVGEAHLAALSLVQRSLEEGGPQQGLPEGIAPQQSLCVLPHGAVVLVVERVDGAGERPGGGVRRRQRPGGVVRQCRVDWRGFIDRRPVRRDETREG